MDKSNSNRVSAGIVASGKFQYRYFFFAICCLVSPAAFPQLLIKSANAAIVDNMHSNLDIILAGLPGILISGFALIVAIQARLRNKRLEADLVARNNAVEQSAIGVWEIDSNGNTLSLNNSMYRLFGIDNIQMIDAIDNQWLQSRLQPISPQSDLKQQPYLATLRTRQNADVPVLVFEQLLSSEPNNNHPVILRSVIDLSIIQKTAENVSSEHIKLFTAAA